MTTSWVLGLAVLCAVGCGGSAPDPRYPAHEAGCPVKTFPGKPPVPVDELGTVTVECSGRVGACERQALDVVCSRGGDVAWGLADNALTSTTLVVHAAHTRRALEGSRERGCPVQVFADAPNIPTENVGPVTALCSTDDSKDVCLRELQDQVCLLGGDVVWQMEGPTTISTSEGYRQRMRGRAAHSKAQQAK
jgi:hypothetical protein